jgi:hypothetical protein
MPTKAALPPDRQVAMRKALRQTDAIARISGYEKTEQRKALDNAMLAGRATPQTVQALLVLEARLLGARDVLANMDRTDTRYPAITQNFERNLAVLYTRADAMGGAVRATLKL